uniref:Uncharacterized protein n=1 Tax=Romanomermis culicivorax TaxID=13658 RepID=A0A915KUV5_ROMCU
TLYNNEFSGTTRGDEALPCSAPQRCQPPAANHFGFLDYPPDDYYDHPQPWYKMPRTSHREEDSRIKTIVDNMHPLIIDGAATNKRLSRFFIRLENEFGYNASNHIATAAADRNLTDHEPSALDESFPCHTAQQKLELALNKMTKKTYVSTAQKAKALTMLQHN